VQLRDGDCGIAAVREILRRRSVPVIFVTGHDRRLIADPQLRESLVLGKPFAQHALEAAVRRIFDAHA
jgi:DNA-binding LytR/AlgR family response regulator